VHEALLGEARKAHPHQPDDVLFDAALAALIAHSCPVRVDDYSAYDSHPIDEADEWGDLESFRSAVAAT
jgi:hypothetical protein